MLAMKLTTFFGLIAFTSAALPIPKREVGYVYKSGSPTAGVKLDLYIDLACPESRDAFPTMLKVADHYGPDKLRLRTRLFSLSFLSYGFYAAKGCHVIDMLSSNSHTYTWMQRVFANYDSLNNATIQGQSDNQVIDKLADIADGIGIPASTFKTAFQNSSTEWTTRVAWKYVCSRRVSGVPTFMVNDVYVDATKSWRVSDWKNLIDPLLGITPQPKPEPKDSSNVLSVGTWTVAVMVVMCYLSMD